jgi:hypothetical protein
MSTMAGMRSMPSLWGPLGDAISEDLLTLTSPGIVINFEVQCVVLVDAELYCSCLPQLLSHDDNRSLHFEEPPPPRAQRRT